VKTKKQRITAAAAKRVGGKLGVDWAKVDLDQFRRGLEVELEHGARDPQTNVTNNDMDLTGKIAWAHLKESPDYYTRLTDSPRPMPTGHPGVDQDMLQRHRIPQSHCQKRLAQWQAH
jgi:hypothetical protein